MMIERRMSAMMIMARRMVRAGDRRRQPKEDNPKAPVKAQPISPEGIHAGKPPPVRYDTAIILMELQRGFQEKHSVPAFEEAWH